LWETGRIDPAGDPTISRWVVGLEAFAATGGAAPGRVTSVCSPTTARPFDGMKAHIRLTSALGPPAASQGSHTLYEWPSLDLL